jgi:glycosyltransferase involved in cell wall biosynthesis
VTEQRLSLGGQVVRNSLAAVGYEPSPFAVSLVETSKPLRAPYEVVLAQNAWCVIGRSQFRELVGAYPRRHQARHRARRVVASVNLQRATRTVALSHAMGGMMRHRGLRPTVCPVTLPMDFIDQQEMHRRPVWVPDEGPFVVLPGSVTWYKNSDWVISLVRQLRRSAAHPPRVVLAGGDDGSGCLQHIQRALDGAALHGVVSRPEMRWLLTHATATVVPSHLESLSFSLSEALVCSPHVIASPLEVHREVASRVGRQPVWIGGSSTIDELVDRVSATPPPPRGRQDLAMFSEEWRALSSRLSSLARG